MMDTKTYLVDSLPDRIILGRQTENGVRQIRIDCQPWIAQWPGMEIDVWVTPASGEAHDAYPAKVKMDGDVCEWTVSSFDTATAGEGTIEIVGLLDGLKKLSAIAETYVLSTTTALPGTTPEAYSGWVDQVLVAGAEAKDSAELAAASEQIATAAADRAETAAAAAEASAESATESETKAAESADLAQRMAADALSCATMAANDAANANSASVSAQTSYGFAMAEADKAAKSATAAATSEANAATSAEAAQAVLDSIPADYTALAAEVDALADPVTKERTDFFACDKSINLFDVSSSIDGYYFKATSGDTGSLVAHAMSAYAYVKHDGPGTYYTKVNASTFGVTVCLNMTLFDADYVCIGKVKGEADDPTAEASSMYGMHFTLAEEHIAAGVVYIGLSLHKGVKDQVMLVKGDSYPEQYIAYRQEWSIPDLTVLPENAKPLLANPLYGKTAVFDGDSICNGYSANDGLSGWAGRIGTGNAMTWRNYGIGGGTITQYNDKHCIGGNIETIHADYPTLDYLILEGGTNDADVLGEDGLGTYSPTDYGGSYDLTTFSGAFETMLYKAVTLYPHAKIGYIVAHKMGAGNGAARRRTYFDRAVELCIKWGVPYLDLWHGTHLNRILPGHYDASLDAQGNRDAGSLYTDGQHLTSAGYDLITPKIEAWMRTL